MLKKVIFSPTRPRRAETPLFRGEAAGSLDAEAYGKYVETSEQPRTKLGKRRVLVRLGFGWV